MNVWPESFDDQSSSYIDFTFGYVLFEPALCAVVAEQPLCKKKRAIAARFVSR